MQTKPMNNTKPINNSKDVNININHKYIPEIVTVKSPWWYTICICIWYLFWAVVAGIFAKMAWGWASDNIVRLFS